MSKFKIDYHCLCGTSFSVETNSRKTSNEVFEIFMQFHKGKEHKSVTAKTARKARKKIEEDK